MHTLFTFSEPRHQTRVQYSQPEVTAAITEPKERAGFVE